MKQVIFIRHGPTAGNLERRYIGRTDEPLLEGWRPEIAVEADRIFVSPMLRTRQTAALLFPGRDYTVVPDLRETDFGQFEGKTADELADCQAYRQWVDGGCTAPIPGGESVAAFKARCCRAFQLAVLDLPEGSTAAFVIHGGCIMAILEAYARPKREFYAYHVPNGAAVCCTLEGEVLTVR